MFNPQKIIAKPLAHISRPTMKLFGVLVLIYTVAVANAGTCSDCTMLDSTACSLSTTSALACLMYGGTWSGDICTECTTSLIWGGVTAVYSDVDAACTGYGAGGKPVCELCPSI